MVNQDLTSTDFGRHL